MVHAVFVRSREREGESHEKREKERSSDAREGEGASSCHGSEGARARSESEARGRGGIGSSRSLETEEHGKAREARSGGLIKHPEIVCISIDAPQERLTASIIAEEKGAGKLLSFADQHGDRQREPCLYCIESARGSSFSVCSEGGRGMDACLSHGQEARAAVYGSLGIVVQSKEGDRGERLRNGAEALGDFAPEQSGESRGLCRREANREPGLCPGEFLSAVKTESEGEAEAPRLAIREASRP
jgi:hypothetical protein